MPNCVKHNNNNNNNNTNTNVKYADDVLWDLTQINVIVVVVDGVVVVVVHISYGPAMCTAFAASAFMCNVWFCSLRTIKTETKKNVRNTLQRNGNDSDNASALRRQQFLPKGKFLYFPNTLGSSFTLVILFFCSGISANWSVCIFGVVKKGQKIQIHRLLCIICTRCFPFDVHRFDVGRHNRNGRRMRNNGNNFIPTSNFFCSIAINNLHENEDENGQWPNCTIKRRCLFDDYFDCYCCQPFLGSSRKLLFIGSYQMTAIVVLVFTWMEGTQRYIL